MVKEMRTPSSSSSVNAASGVETVLFCPVLTDNNRLDPDALFDVGCIWSIRDLVGDDLGFAEGINKGRTARSRGTFWA